MASMFKLIFYLLSMVIYQKYGYISLITDIAISKLLSLLVIRQIMIYNKGDNKGDHVK